MTKFAYVLTATNADTGAKPMARLSGARDADYSLFDVTHNLAHRYGNPTTYTDARLLILPKYVDEDSLDYPTAVALKLGEIAGTPEQLPNLASVTERRKQVEAQIRARLTRGQLSYIAQEQPICAAS